MKNQVVNYYCDPGNLVHRIIEREDLKPDIREGLIESCIRAGC